MQHLQAVERHALELIVTFLRQHSARNDQRQLIVEMESISGLDKEFQAYWYALREGLDPVQDEAFLISDAVQRLCPDPITGVSEFFRAHLLKYGQFDLVSGRGSVLL